MSRARQDLGKSGEKQAARYLKKQGYILVETNYKTRFGEIDIIARDKDVLCFIEVKARSEIQKALPRQAVNPAKQKKIINTASFFLKEQKLTDQRARFDVIEMIPSNGDWQINLIPNAFQAG
ncbi:YraN family protein [Desulfospira joergensenii]|uniref:YraN family protein n=1 Tax=Desulfospira joergensenii TaxID=53329 RepID=UPI0003B786C0|nr:YraN family protein [Desulfospira joergensenii]